LHRSRLPPGPAQRGKQEGDQQGDDPDDNQQLDEREPPGPAATAV
jgi:hypothetical protein